MSKNLLITPNKSGDPLRDPEEEFFMLAVLTHKMLHNEKYDDAEYVYQISAAKMFKEAKQQKLPFHKWYSWLEGKFNDLRNENLGPQSPDKGEEDDEPDSHIS